LHRAVMLWLATDMGLPTRTLVQGAVAQAVRIPLGVEAAGQHGPEVSWILDTDEQHDSADLALLLLSLLADPGTAEPAFWRRADQARNRLAAHQTPMTQALVLLALMKSGKAPFDPARADEVLAAVSPEAPTIDRALTLALINKAMR